MRKGNAETTVGKQKKKKLEKKGVFVSMFVFSFQNVAPPGATEQREWENMSFYPLCLCTLCIWQPVTIKPILPAFCISLERKGYLYLSAAKGTLEIRWKWPDSMQGWGGRERTGRRDMPDGLLSDPWAKGGKQISCAGTFLCRNIKVIQDIWFKRWSVFFKY